MSLRAIPREVFFQGLADAGLTASETIRVIEAVEKAEAKAQTSFGQQGLLNSGLTGLNQQSAIR